MRGVFFFYLNEPEIGAFRGIQNWRGQGATLKPVWISVLAEEEDY